MLFDPWMINTLADRFPEFHGRPSFLAMPPALGQNIEYDRTSVSRDCTFYSPVQIGRLAPYRDDGANTEYLCQSSLKLTQYTYTRLPVPAP